MATIRDHNPDLIEPCGEDVDGRPLYLLRGEILTEAEADAHIAKQHARLTSNDELDVLLATSPPLDGLELHVRAETLLRLKGKGDNYTSAEYVAACNEVTSKGA